MTYLPVESAVLELVPNFSTAKCVRNIGGGCISEAWQVAVVGTDGQAGLLFVKSNHSDFLDNFASELDGLRRLGESGAIGVPEPIAIGMVVDRAYLIMEWIQQSPVGDVFFADFGIALADLHRATIGDRIGFERDNYLGSAQQINGPLESWPEFFAVQRIEFQLRWAVQQGLAGASLRRDCEKIVRDIDALLSDRDDATSLLHGDLWSGNFLCGPGGRPVVIDPAAYYGCREAEFGMLTLFGACSSSFYQAYDQRFPLPDGWQRRVGVYALYHLLNHLNLFGGSYQDRCESTAAEILRGGMNQSVVL